MFQFDVELFRQIIREEIQNVLNEKGTTRDLPPLLTVEQLMELFSTSVQRHPSL